MPGKNEQEFRVFCHVNEFEFEKKPDMRKCWKCGAPAFQKRTAEEDKREVKASRVDFMIMIGDRYGWVECKTGDDDSWPWADDEHGTGLGIITGQRLWMNDKTAKGINCYIFLSIGEGRAPAGRMSYLIPWSDWLITEIKLREAGMKSIPWKKNRTKRSELNIATEFSHCALQWVQRQGWKLPSRNPLYEDFFPVIPESKEAYRVNISNTQMATAGA